MKCDGVHTIVIELILKELNDQCARLCEKVHFKSMLQQSILEDLLKFARAAAAPPRLRNKHKGVTVVSRCPHMCVGGTVLLKEHNKDMSALHQLVGIYLFHGDLHKSVSIG